MNEIERMIHDARHDVFIQILGQSVPSVLVNERRIDRRVRFRKWNYKHFLRLNNRKTFQKFKDIKAAGYLQHDIDVDSVVAATQWCVENCRYRFVRNHNTFWFAESEDATMFALRWK